MGSDGECKGGGRRTGTREVRAVGAVPVIPGTMPEKGGGARASRRREGDTMRHLHAQRVTLYRVLWTRVLWTYPPRELLRRLWAVLSLRRARTFVAPAPEAATTRSREERRAPLGAAGAIPVAHACPAGRKAAWSAVRAEGCADFVVHTAPRLVGSGHRCDLTRCAHCGASIERRRPIYFAHDRVYCQPRCRRMGMVDARDHQKLG